MPYLCTTMAKPSIPKGTRDFGPVEMMKRQYLFSVLRSCFIKYGFLPIETSALELLTTLTGKYGEEGDRLLFKVLNNGDFLAKADDVALANKDSNKLVASIARRGLRYDLTVPFARFVAMHQHEINLPFKRYQIQPVWRADAPQRGRYQEFYQCDADVVGSASLMYEAELILLYQEVFETLGLRVKILMNHRKVLQGVAEVFGLADRFTDMTVAIDKWDKIGADGVRNEMLGRGLPATGVEQLITLLSKPNVATLHSLLAGNEIGEQGLRDIDMVQSYLNSQTIAPPLVLDLTLARGLNYYTGCIFEVKVDTSRHPEVTMGSIGGGGRYDDLTGNFDLPGVPGVGISFGAERIFDVIEELNLWPDTVYHTVKALIIAFDAPTHQHAFELLTNLRQAGIATDLYPEPAKMKKQMGYADKRQVPYVILVGETEMQSGKYALKNMQTGDQQSLSLQQLIEHLNS